MLSSSSTVAAPFLRFPFFDSAVSVADSVVLATRRIMLSSSSTVAAPFLRFPSFDSAVSVADSAFAVASFSSVPSASTAAVIPLSSSVFSSSTFPAPSSVATVYTCCAKPATAPNTAPLMMSVNSSCSKIGCRTRSNSAGVISAIRSRMSVFRSSVSSMYSWRTCTWSCNRSLTLATTASTSSGSSTPDANKPRPCNAASSRTNSRVYSVSARSNSSPFAPLSMLSHTFSLVSTLLARWSENSPDTSSCRCRNKPWILIWRKKRYTGSTGSKMHLSAIQLVSRPTIVPPMVSVHGLS